MNIAPSAKKTEHMKHVFVLIGLLSSAFLHAQGLEPTATEALLKVSTTNVSGEAKASEKISFTSGDGQVWSVVTDEAGLAEILVPKGSTYMVSYMAMDGNKDHSQIEIPGGEGRIQFELKLEYEAPRMHTLENVNFDTGSAEVAKSSNPYLEQLVELLNLKPNMHIEISGHTDNVGEPAKNQQLSEARAKAVRTFLVGKGIAASRVEAVGYGETRPIANNDLQEGRLENRRTEVRVLSE